MKRNPIDELMLFTGNYKRMQTLFFWTCMGFMFAAAVCLFAFKDVVAVGYCVVATTISAGGYVMNGLLDKFMSSSSEDGSSTSID